MGTDRVEKPKKGWILAGLLGCAILGNWGCAIREDVSDPGGGIAVEIKDSSKIDVDFDNLARSEYRDSGEFDLGAVRKTLADKGISLETVAITNLEVSYDDATKAFLEANQGVKYYLRIYIKDVGDTGPGKLALKTYKKDPGDVTLTLDPAIALFELNKTIYPDGEGYPDLLAGIKNTSKEKMYVIAVLTFLDPLKATGLMHLKVVVTVGGQV